MFPFFQACQATQTYFLVRAAQNWRVQEREEEITYALTSARSWPSQTSRPSASSSSTWSARALDPVASGLWADDALAPARTRHERARTP